jgi:phage gp37-like protein
MHEFGELEDAIITALTPMLSSGLRTLDAYSGQLDVEEVEEVTLQFPCIYVIASGLRLTEGNRYDAYDMGATLIVGDRNLRGSKAAARGDSASPGVYQLLKEARDRLHHIKVLSAWAPLVLERETPIAYAAKLNLCLYQAEYGTKMKK